MVVQPPIFMCTDLCTIANFDMFADYGARTYGYIFAQFSIWMDYETVLWMLDSAFSMPTTITTITPQSLYRGKHVFTASAQFVT